MVKEQNNWGFQRPEIGLRIFYLFKFVVLASLSNTFAYGSQQSIGPKTDSLPAVLAENHSDLTGCRLKFDAGRLFTQHQIPQTKSDWLNYRPKLKSLITFKTGLVINHNLPLNLKETGSIQMNGYSVRNIFFQTRPGVCATANLYIPAGKGKFPAVIVMMGHSLAGRLDDRYQALGHTLALNGYVVLCIDPWGAGERTTVHGVFEDHGDENNLGSSLLNIGEPLMGIELSDNIRGVDLLYSLPYVDNQNIGATGSSGGGNQTMWLAAMDERIKAAVPVVSAGTFESYIMGTPCICEVLPDGLNLTEEAGILSLIAPRAIKMCNHQKDNNQAFRPSEMIRSYRNAKPVFQMYGADKNIGYQIFDLTHGYFPEDREVMLGWFDLYLKGTGDGSPKKEVPFELLPKEKLMVFSKGERDSSVIGTVTWCKSRGNRLRGDFLNSKSVNIEQKSNEIREILGIKPDGGITAITEFSDSRGWRRIAIETSDKKTIPLLVTLPTGNSHNFTLVCDPSGKNKIPVNRIGQLIASGNGIVIVDLSGTGEVLSNPNSADQNGTLLTMSRSLLWFGKTVIGEWVTELKAVTDFLHSKYHADKIDLDANKEAGVAALFFGALGGKIDNLILRNTPVSYLFDSRENIDFYNFGINIPGILKWGDISLAAAMTEANISFIDPVTMSGRKLNPNELSNCRIEFENERLVTKKQGSILFLNPDKAQ